MAVVSGKELLLPASKAGYAVGAFNVTSPLQMIAVLEAANEIGSPVIIQTSVTPAKFYGPKVWSAFFRAAADAVSIPAALHLDHCTDVAFCKTCVDAGYTSIMMDGSREAFEENCRQTSAICDYAHPRGASVEGELGTVSGVEDQVAVVEDEAVLCDPPTAVAFIERTSVDYLAPAIGTAHGIYASKNPKVDFVRLERVQTLVNGAGVRVPLVIHGGTGLPEETVRRLVRLGGAKVNVSTELKHVLIDASFEYVSEHRDEYDPGSLDKHVKNAVKTKVSYWIALIGSAGRA